MWMADRHIHEKCVDLYKWINHIGLRVLIIIIKTLK